MTNTNTNDVTNTGNVTNTAGAVPPIWRPDPAASADSAIAEFGRFVTGRTGAKFDGYRDLWRWSVEIAAHASPRHVPDDIIAVAAIPHTRTGKKLEIPVKRIIQGHPLERVVARDAVDDYDALTQFTAYAGYRGRTPA